MEDVVLQLQLTGSAYFHIVEEHYLASLSIDILRYCTRGSRAGFFMRTLSVEGGYE